MKQVIGYKSKSNQLSEVRQEPELQDLQSELSGGG